MTNFSANQILREINYLRFTNAKIVILTILEVLNFDLSKFEPKLQGRNGPKLKSRVPNTYQNMAN